jgi:hypothetical protein
MQPEQTDTTPITVASFIIPYANATSSLVSISPPLFLYAVFAALSEDHSLSDDRTNGGWRH